MDKSIVPPATLAEALRYFADPDTCLAFMVAIRWPSGEIVCPRCGKAEPSFIESRRIWQCGRAHDKRQFSIKTGTIFEDSALGMEKWLPAVWMLVNDKNGISSYELARALGVTQKTAWFMLQRIRLAMQSGSLDKLRGRVEGDKTFIGGNVRNMHKRKRERVMQERGGGQYSKAIIMSLLEPGGRVRAKAVGDVTRATLQGIVRANVKPGSEVITDAAPAYSTLSAGFIHNFINHLEPDVRGHVHTNGIENFWSLLKRALKGYVKVEPFHLHRYVDEQAFRYNERTDTDAGRFVKALRSIVGRRLTYRALTIGQAPA